jgi:hypothetical protein
MLHILHFLHLKKCATLKLHILNQKSQILILSFSYNKKKEQKFGFIYFSFSLNYPEVIGVQITLQLQL